MRRQKIKEGYCDHLIQTTNVAEPFYYKISLWQWNIFYKVAKQVVEPSFGKSVSLICFVIQTGDLFFQWFVLQESTLGLLLFSTHSCMNKDFNYAVHFDF